jgi:hypothetical protein
MRSRPGRSAALAALLLGVAVSALRAQGLPDGPDFQVNSTTPWEQREAQLAILPDGEFLVVWRSTDSAGPHNIRSRHFQADGVPSGSDMQVNTSTTMYHRWPSVVVDNAGGFVAVYEGGTRIDGREFAGDGQPSGAEFVVEAAERPLYTPVVDTAPDGRRVVVWDGYEGIYSRLYDADGNPAGEPFLVHVETIQPWSQSYPNVAVTDDAQFMVVWTRRTGDIVGRRFAADGAPLGETFEVSTLTGFQTRGAIAATDEGGFIVAWDSYRSSAGTDSSRSSVQVREFDGAGTPLGPEFQVNTYTTGLQSSPDIEVVPGGGFVVSWHSEGSSDTDRSGSTVVARRFDAAGRAYSGEFQLNSVTTDYQFHAEIEFEPGGALRAVWTSRASAGDDTSESSIQTRRFLPPLFADGFELGDASRWIECTNFPTCGP